MKEFIAIDLFYIIRSSLIKTAAINHKTKQIIINLGEIVLDFPGLHEDDLAQAWHELCCDLECRDKE